MKYLLLFLFSFSLQAENAVSFIKLHGQFTKDRGAIMSKYRNKTITYTANATSINKGVQGTYVIGLEGIKGRVVIGNEEIPQDLNKLLWKQRREQNTKLKISFKGTWSSNRSETFYFTEVSEITYKEPGKKVKKKKKKK